MTSLNFLRSFVLAAFVTFALLGMLARARAETRIGANVTCSAYLSSKGAARSEIEGWVMGYASGANSVASLVWNRDYLAGQTRATVVERITSLCSASPGQTISAVASTYLKGLREH